MVDLVTRGATHTEAARQHGVTRQRVSQLVSEYLAEGRVRRLDDGTLVWTPAGRSYRSWIADAPGVSGGAA